MTRMALLRYGHGYMARTGNIGYYYERRDATDTAERGFIDSMLVRRRH